jgi:hypothetical protein
MNMNDGIELVWDKIFKRLKYNFGAVLLNKLNCWRWSIYTGGVFKIKDGITKSIHKVI